MKTIFRQILILLVGGYFIYGALRPCGCGLVNSADLAIHEGGHVIFGVFGEYLGMWGGTLMQLERVGTLDRGGETADSLLHGHGLAFGVFGGAADGHDRAEVVGGLDDGNRRRAVLWVEGERQAGRIADGEAGSRGGEKREQTE